MLLEAGIRAALSGVPGPAFLEIPIDVLAGRVDMEKVGVPRFRDYRVASRLLAQPAQGVASASVSAQAISNLIEALGDDDLRLATRAEMQAPVL